MILLISLFAVIIVISFLLAFWSMKDFKAIPKGGKTDYGLFLIRNTSAFTEQILQSIMLADKDSIISLERLFKGTEAALAIYGPKDALSSFIQSLNLLEIEEYTDIEVKRISLWEVGFKNSGKADLKLEKMPFNILKLRQDEQVWVQVLVKGAFTLVRVAAIADSPLRRKEILENFIKEPFVKIPRPYSAEKIYRFYKLRGMSIDQYSLKLNFSGIMRIISLS